MFSRLSALNQVLKAVSPEKRITSYSFRRGFINHMKEKYGSPEEVKMHTMHRRSDTLTAYYFKSPSEMKDERDDCPESEPLPPKRKRNPFPMTVSQRRRRARLSRADNYLVVCPMAAEPIPEDAKVVILPTGMRLRPLKESTPPQSMRTPKKE